MITPAGPLLDRPDMLRSEPATAIDGVTFAALLGEALAGVQFSKVDRIDLVEFAAHSAAAALSRDGHPASRHETLLPDTDTDDIAPLPLVGPIDLPPREPIIVDRGESLVPPSRESTDAAHDILAERFNEDGFFSASAETGPSPRSLDPKGHPEPPPPTASSVTATTGAHAAPRFLAMINCGASDAIGLRVASPPVSTAPSDAPEATKLSVMTAPAVPRAVRTTIARWKLPDRPADVRAPPLKNAASTSPVVVAVHHVASGLAVVARVTGLDTTDRALLSEEIAALLARHGLPAADILISARKRDSNPRQGRN